MTRHLRRFVLSTAWAACLLGAPAAHAQQPARGRIEVTGGARWIGPVQYRDVPALETTPGGGTTPQFGSATQLDGAIGAAGSFGVGLSRQLRLEVGVSYTPASLTTRITSDVEGLPDTTVDAPVSQFLVQGGVVVQPAGWSSGRFAPFLSAGIGYLRQLNDGRTLVETGRSYYFGGGLYYVRATSGQRRVKATGLRLEARGLILSGGVAPDDTVRATPALSAAAFVRF